MDTVGESGKVSGRNVDHAIRNWRKDYLYYKVTKNLDKKYFRVLWKADFASKEIKFLAKWISKQNLKEQHSSS